MYAPFSFGIVQRVLTLKFLNNLPKLSTFNTFVMYPFVWREDGNDPQVVPEKDHIKQVKR